MVRLHLLTRTILLLGLLVLPTSASAQWSYFASVTSAYDSNPLELSGAPSSVLTSVEGGLRYNKEKLGLSYTGNLAGYSQIESYDAYWHQLYATFGDHTTSASVSAEQRLMTQDDTYGYFRVGARLMRRLEIASFRTILTLDGGGYRFDVLKERNQWSGAASLNTSRSFQTRTTLLAGVGAGHSRYSFLGDMLPDMGIGGERADHPSTTQLTGTVRISQSVTPTTGVAIQAQRRALRSNLQPDSFAGYDASFALVDDPSLYASRTFSALLTQMLLNYTATLRVGIYHVHRRYVAQGSYLGESLYDAGTAREDDDLTAWTSLTWRGQPEWLGARPLEVELAGQWTSNDSNSYWFDYDNQYVSLSASLYSR